MKLNGQYRLFPGTCDEFVIKNNIPQEGEAALLKMMFRGDDTIVADGGNFYLGLKDAAYASNLTLASLTGEPSGAGGYARQPLVRNNANWPNLLLVNGVYRIGSISVNFTATGADYSTAFSRLFLCSVVSGSAGILLSVSGALSVPTLIQNGVTLPVQYELYLG